MSSELSRLETVFSKFKRKYLNKRLSEKVAFIKLAQASSDLSQQSTSLYTETDRAAALALLVESLEPQAEVIFMAVIF